MTDFLLWVTAIGAVMTSAFTGLLWWVARGTLGGAETQLQLLREQAERDSRPFVTADVVPGLHGIGSWDLILTNTGRSLALNVVFDFDEWLKRGEDDYITENLIAFLRAPQTLVPGARKRVMWRSERENGHGEAGAAESLALSASYSDERFTSYATRFDLSLAGIRNAAPAPNEGATTIGSSVDEKVSLANINHALRTLNIHVGELRR